MGSGIPVSLIVEMMLAALLMATLVFCALLERRLRLLRKDEESLTGTIRALNAAIAAAQASLGGLRAAAKDADEKLGRNVTAARALADELSLLTSAGERAAGRIDAARETALSGRKRVPAAEGARALR